MTTASLWDRLRDAEREAGELGQLLEAHEGGASELDLSTYRDDPVGFLRDVLQADPWRLQETIAETVRDEPLVTVRSCHAAGKDWLAARLALWWVYACRGLVILTGPTRAQVEEILMRGEIRDAFSRAGDLPGSLHVNALRPGGEGRAGILAKTATGVSSLTGFHDVRVLFVVTEAQDPEIDHAWDAAFACTTGAEDRILTLGNPTAPSGRFFSAHQNADWRALKIAAADIPNVREGETVVPGLLTRQGVDRFASEYGEGSGFYISRVLAEFPEEGEGSLFRRSWLDAAAERRNSEELEGRAVGKPVRIAVDPARYGPDQSVAAVRQGPIVRELVSWSGMDTMETVKKVEEIAGTWGPWCREHEVEIVVDEIGVGAGVLDRLKERKGRGFRATGFKGTRSPAQSSRFKNARAESYWGLRKALEAGEVALPADEALFEELLAIRWRPTAAGLVQLEAKMDVRSRLRRSPDRADAVTMALYDHRRRAVGVDFRLY